MEHFYIKPSYKNHNKYNKINQPYFFPKELLLYPRSPKGEGVYCFTSVRLSFRPSKIFFVAFFSVTVDGSNRKQESDGSKIASHNMAYLYEACEQILDSCHQ
jgi:hypothetical protein